ncbi:MULTISPECIES: hypothetical protein [unclassified Bradyrhizobium]|uniref:hypothetical protein n=1 Tax=unclassified Bradyrhizobium TaxID=2631580 RepID=UPI0029160696|nr:MULTISPECIES: hypothetical protein [unclassified Bradyrhizobium]
MSKKKPASSGLFHTLQTIRNLSERKPLFRNWLAKFRLGFPSSPKNSTAQLAQNGTKKSDRLAVQE